jgi:hypothetical protein
MTICKLNLHAPAPSTEEELSRIEMLRNTVAHYLPDFLQGKDRGETIILHQDAFAADYNLDEYTLLGMAIKCAGLLGIKVIVTGSNTETFRRQDT